MSRTRFVPDSRGSDGVWRCQQSSPDWVKMAEQKEKAPRSTTKPKGQGDVINKVLVSQKNTSKLKGN